ncbi:MAG TPA: LysE family translocator [Chloroflexota bacterium]
MGTLLPFLAVSALVIMTPGPDTALTIRNVLLGGRRGGIFTALGVSTGQAVWALATAAGLAALLTASRPAFVAVKLAGAAYLVYLGAAALRSALRHGASQPEDATVRVAGPMSGRFAFRQGVLSNLANPKMAVYFTAVLPQVVGTAHAAFVPLAAFGFTFSVLTLAWLSLYAVTVSWAGHLLLRPRVRRALEAVTGAVLIALGLRVAVEAR